jgi:group II intron reverse transcriptase/maturase
MEPLKGKMTGTSSSESVSTRLQRVAEASREAPGMVWTTLSHHIDLELLKNAYQRTRKDGATGIDGQSAKEYAEDLEGNLQGVLDRFKSGRYKAPPVKRVYIPKGDGKKTRPIGIPTFEDKVLQRAVTMVLEAVYEQDFLDCSYGFRPGRSAHQALSVLWSGLMDMGGGYVYEVDIRKFFDTLVPRHLRSFLDQRVRDGVIRKAIDKWLKAGVMEEGQLRHEELGTPQGGVISPLLANIYLHEVLDCWFKREVLPRLSGKAFLIRYCDDFVIAFSTKEDAMRVIEVLPKRFERFGLNLHPDKTRLVPFRCFRSRDPGSFDFLGFTHYWGKSRKGGPVIKRKTARDRFTRSLRKIAQWCRRNRHVPVRDQWQILSLKLRGHFNYYGVTGNADALERFAQEVRRVWRKWLDRRSQRARMAWDRFNAMLKRYPLPKPLVVHSVYRLAASP